MGSGLPGTTPSSERLSVDALNVIIAFPPTPLTAQWWFWVLIAALAGGTAGLITSLFRRRYQRKKEAEEYDLEADNALLPPRYGMPAGARPWEQSSRYREAGQAPGTANGTEAASASRRTTRPGWRRPWR